MQFGQSSRQVQTAKKFANETRFLSSASLHYSTRSHTHVLGKAIMSNSVYKPPESKVEILQEGEECRSCGMIYRSSIPFKPVLITTIIISVITIVIYALTIVAFVFTTVKLNIKHTEDFGFYLVIIVFILSHFIAVLLV